MRSFDNCLFVRLSKFCRENSYVTISTSTAHPLRPSKTYGHLHCHGSASVGGNSLAFSIAAMNQTEGRESKISNRAAFQAIPVHPSILAHIEKIGVGIRSKPSLSRKRRSNLNKHCRQSDDSLEDTLNQAEEIEFFTNREREHSAHWRDQRRDRYAPAGKKKHGPQKAKFIEPTGSYWLPPPPFSSARSSNKQIDGEHALKDCKITRLPVKCLGRAGSLKDKLPLESKGLSEIAIIGRSNGKCYCVSM